MNARISVQEAEKLAYEAVDEYVAERNRLNEELKSILSDPRVAQKHV